MEGIAFYVDASVTLAQGTSSWVQIAKMGRFSDPRYGEFSITQKDFDSWIKNFSTLGTEEGLPIDVDHGPEKRGDTEAAGWVKEIEQRGLELWARAEWNTLGKQLIEDRRYLFLSPSYAPNYKNEEGRSFGTALVGVGLTNRPFLSMAAISLSRVSGEFASELEDQTVLDSPSRMELSANILKALGIDGDASDEKVVLDAIAGLQTEPAEVKSLDAQAKDEGKIVLDAAQVNDLVTKANAGEAAAKQLSQMRFDSAWTVALDGGKVVPAQQESFQKLYDIDSDTTLNTLDGLQPVVNTAPVGAGGNSLPVGGVAAGQFSLDSMGVDDDRLDVHNRAISLSKDREITYIDAVALIERGEA